jgi:hypothetical protein
MLLLYIRTVPDHHSRSSHTRYHVLSGKKVFFMIAPTQENLKRYEKWVTSPSQGNIFLARKVRPARLASPLLLLAVSRPAPTERIWS